MNYACHSERSEESGDPSLLLRVTNSILFFSLYLKEAIYAYAVEDGKLGYALACRPL
jgi:hypothetical protein